jgi:hypothetical protein
MRSSRPRSPRRLARLAIAVAVALGACGRIGYDGVGDDGPGDASTTADAAAAAADAGLDVDAPGPSDAAPGPDAPPAVADAAPPDAPAALACGSSIVCDGFDGVLAGWTPRGAVDPGTSFDLVEDPVIEGAGALRFRTDVDNGVLWMIERRFSAITSGTIYGRAMVWVDAATTFDDFLVVLQLDNGDDSGAQKVSVDLLPEDRIALTATTASPAAQPTSAASAVRHDQWMCLRFTIGVANSGGSLRLTRDGTVLASASGIDTRPEPSGFVRFMIGVAAARRATGEIVFDGVALSSQALACP